MKQLSLLLKAVDSKHPRPYAQVVGINNDDDEACITDGYGLVTVKVNNLPQTDGKPIDVNGQISNARFPLYKEVVPSRVGLQKLNIYTKELLLLLKGFNKSSQAILNITLNLATDEYGSTWSGDLSVSMATKHNRINLNIRTLKKYLELANKLNQSGLDFYFKVGERDAPLLCVSTDEKLKAVFVPLHNLNH